VLISDTLPNHEDIAVTLEDADIWTAVLETASTLPGIRDFVTAIGFYAEAEAAALRLVDELMEEVEAIEYMLMDVQEHHTVYFEVVGMYGTNTFGSDNFFNLLLDIAGGINIFDAQTGWVAASNDDIVAANPAVILSSVRGFNQATLAEEMAARVGWGDIRAVQDGRIYVIDPDVRPNHNMVRALRQIAQALYPEYINE